MDCPPEISKLSVNNLGDSQLEFEMFMLMLTFQTSPKFCLLSCTGIPEEMSQNWQPVFFFFFFFLNDVHP